jgi:glycerol uptake facilitator-like aquaporin
MDSTMACKMQFPLRPRIVCEFIGSMFLVIAAIAPIILFNNVLKTGIGIAILADAIAVGFVLFVLIEMFEPISGGHFNPAVTIAMLIADKCEGKGAAFYIPAQIAGGLSGLLLTHLTFFHYDGMNTVIQISEVSRGGGTYVAEFLGTFILVTAIMFIGQHGSKMLPLSVGLLVGGMLITSSSTMFANPQVTIARVFTYSAAGVSPLDGVIFIIMEITAAAIAVLFFRFIFAHLYVQNK